MSALSILASALRILPRVQVSVDKVFNVLMSLFNSLTSFLEKDMEYDELIETPYVLAHKNFVLESLLGLVIESLAGIAAHNPAVLEKMKENHEKLVEEVLVNYSSNEVILSGIFGYLDLLHSG